MKPNCDSKPDSSSLENIRDWIDAIDAELNIDLVHHYASSTTKYPETICQLATKDAYGHTGRYSIKEQFMKTTTQLKNFNKIEIK